MESEELKKLPFCIIFKKNKEQNFQNSKYHIFGSLVPRFGQKWIFYKDWASSLVNIYSPLTSCKKSGKKIGIVQFWEKPLTNGRTDGPAGDGTSTCEIVGPIRWNR